MSEANDLRKQIKIYKDRDGIDEIDYSNDGHPLLTIDKIVNAGEEEVVDLYIINRSEHEFEVGHVEEAFDVKTKKEDRDVKLEVERRIIYPNDPVKLTVTFSPKKDRVKALDVSLGIKGRFIIRY